MISTDVARSVRVRFAPSPTGMPHLGSLRTALFNFLYARHRGGSFLLRIEDTDTDRSRPEYEDAMMRLLRWASLMPDEPIMVQSQRLAIYKDIAHRLVREGKAYRCICTPAQLQERIMHVGADGVVYGKYDGLCRSRRISLDEPGVIRFAIPADISSVSVSDLIKGELSFPVETLDDFVILRSDNGPMYNFAVVVDDIALRISHIIRGEEHLVNTPKQLLLYEALEASLPLFAHLPLILGADGSKLSKRDAAADAGEYVRQGYLPEALINYIVRLGWAHGDDELFFDRSDLIRVFTLEGITHKGALFDWKKLDWVNQQHMMRMTPPEVIAYIADGMGIDLIARCVDWSEEQLVSAVRLYMPRVPTLGKLIELVTSVYDGPLSYEVPTLDNAFMSDFETLERVLASCDKLTSGQALEIVKSHVQMPLGKIGPAIRIALTGRLAAPGIGDLLSLLGGVESARRLGVYRST